MESTNQVAVGGSLSSARLRRRVGAGFLALSLTFGGVAASTPAGAEPATAAMTQQVDRRDQACRILERFAVRFQNFPQVLNRINNLRVAFGCISRG